MTTTDATRGAGQATPKRKLIEVALPLEAINRSSQQEKSNPFLRGHPRSLHQWWSRKPQAIARGVLFASLVDDPSSHPDKFPDEAAQDEERQRLFRLIEELVKWENTTNETVLGAARAEIMKSTDGNPPPVLDPFAGGGSIPLEAQRLGLETYASDLNPVAVLINKALIELPPKFTGRFPVNPEFHQSTIKRSDWKGAQGLAEDVRYYAKWMQIEAENRIGRFYPKAELLEGGKASVIAWLWARTVSCPNPACKTQMPLLTKRWLSKRKGKEAWLEPIIDRSQHPFKVSFRVRNESPSKETLVLLNSGTCLINEKQKKVKSTFRCIVCEEGIVKGEYINDEAKHGRLGVMPLALVAEGHRTRTYLSFDSQGKQHTQIPDSLSERVELRQNTPAQPARGTFASNAQGRRYGFNTFSDYFTSRQLLALATYCDLIQEVQREALKDAVGAGMKQGHSLKDEGNEAQAYAEVISTYLRGVHD